MIWSSLHSDQCLELDTVGQTSINSYILTRTNSYRKKINSVLAVEMSNGYLRYKEVFPDSELRSCLATYDEFRIFFIDELLQDIAVRELAVSVAQRLVESDFNPQVKMSDEEEKWKQLWDGKSRVDRQCEPYREFGFEDVIQIIHELYKERFQR